ncbi:MAG: 50S ribosomal protein L5 [Phycisphaeraceae bacterium]|nr:50S ribosomal protein L5 [Phycisphaeraceae bacterium]MCW5754336.1 50S ribosomal protein L5 [Phycisphaeraceae bacterium]
MAEKKDSKPKQPKKGDAVQAEVAGKSRLKQTYDEAVRPKVAETFGITNRMAQPRLEKLTINVNIGRHLDGSKVPPHIVKTVTDTLTKISGQKPILLKAKKSVSNFKVREGFSTALMVTLRRDRMWHFLDRLIHLATPRIKDFRGLPRTGFDGQGNYSMGINEQGVFPEINMAEAEFTHGMNINLTFRNSSKQLSEFVLEQLGMPFTKVGEN